MIYSISANSADQTIDLHQQLSRGRRPELVTKRQPAKIARPRYTFRQRYLPIEGGKLLLRLTTQPELEVDPQTMEFDVLSWGVRLPCSKAEELPTALARQFLLFFSKADAQSLSEQEEMLWVQILDQVDFSSFSIDRAAPHYVEGQLARMEPVCLVDWHDGQRQKIEGEALAALRILRPGDRFGAFVKLGRDNSVKTIERVVIVPPA
jgi:hypothetical protein